MVIFVYAYFIVKNEVNQCERYTRRIPFSQKSILFQDNPPLIAISIRSFFTKKSLIFHLEIIKSVLLVILQNPNIRVLLVQMFSILFNRVHLGFYLVCTIL